MTKKGSGKVKIKKGKLVVEGIEKSEDPAVLILAVFARWSAARDKKKMEFINKPEEFAALYESVDFYPASNYYFGEMTLVREVGYNDATGNVVCFNGVDRVPGGKNAKTHEERESQE